MYTQCPECKAVFEVTAADLAVAGGFVRCGQCSRSFDALNSLTDRLPATEAADAESHTPVPGGEDAVATLEAIADEALPLEDSQESAATSEAIADEAPPVEDGEDEDRAAGRDETRAGEESIDAAEALATPEVEGGDEPEQAASAFTATPDAPAPAHRQADLDEAVAPEAAGPGDEIDDDEILLDESYRPPEGDDDGDELFFEDDEDEDADDSLAAEQIDEAGTDADTDAVDESALFSLPLPELTPLVREGRTQLPEKLEGGAAAHDPSAQTIVPPADGPATARAAVPVGVPAPVVRANDAFDAEDARDLRDYLSAPRHRAATAMWGAGALLMVVLLIAQVVHRNRGDLMIHPRLGPMVQSIYRGFGAELRPNWRIGEYKVVGQARLFKMPADEAVDDAAALRFVAIIANGADRPQPPPIVRLTLRDRWGDPTGIRDFAPPEYLADRSMLGELLEPGQRLRVVLNLQDPGDDVDNFDFDMCLPDGAGTLRCAGEPAG